MRNEDGGGARGVEKCNRKSTMYIVVHQQCTLYNINIFSIS